MVTALPCLFFGTKEAATTAPTENIAPWQSPVKKRKNKSMLKLTLTPVIMLPTKKIIADHTKICFRFNLKNNSGTKRDALIIPIMYKVNDKLTLLSVTLLNVAINGLAIPPGMNMQIPNEKVKIQMLKIPITLVLVRLEVKLSLATILWFLFNKEGLNIFY